MTDRSFSHYLITRFNVPVDAWTTSRKGDAVLSEEWLSHRFTLFETFCLPSVRNQGNQDFTWLVFFGADTPDSYKERVATIARAYGNLVPLYIGAYSELLPTIIGEIQQRLTPSVTHVITSRLDNDDGIHADYVSEIQGVYAAQPLVAVDIPDGYALAIEPVARIGAITAPFNPFISLIEDARDLQTVYSRQHAHWATDAETITISGKRLWLMVIHDRNMSNTFRGAPSASFAGLQADFGISRDVVDSFSNRSGARRVRALARRGLRKAQRTLSRLTGSH